MGILQEQLQESLLPLYQSYKTLGCGAQIAIGVAAFVTLSIVLNVTKQILLKNPNRPPVVFHLVPFIGSTVIYGINPPKFFADCRKKVSCGVLAVRRCIISQTQLLTHAFPIYIVWRLLHLYPPRYPHHGLRRS